MTQSEINSKIEELNSNILANKAKLSDTDYKVTRSIDQHTELSQEFCELRQSWRDQINADQEEIERLKNLEPDPEVTEEETETEEQESN